MNKRFINKSTLSILTLLLFITSCEDNNNDDNIIIIQDSPTFVICEGNFLNGNSTLWSFASLDTQSISGPIFENLTNSPLGDNGQSLSYYNNKLYIIVSNSHKIEILNVNDNLSYYSTIYLPSAQPRHFAFNNGFGFVTCMDLNAILVIDMLDHSIKDTISINGRPDRIISFEDKLYVTVPYISGYTSSNKVYQISADDYTVSNEFLVIDGPGDMAILNNELFIASTYYGADFSKNTGISKINLDNTNVSLGEIQLSSSDLSLGTDLITVNDKIYRISSNGIHLVDDDLSITNASLISNNNIYSAYANDNHIFIGTSDYISPDTVYVYDLDGQIVNNFIVGAIPGDFISVKN